ncbi:uncharacterized protein TM35_000044050 [Trypanosoma theileri]|uniref:Uncharacterized protein n=1 Tax=Trypanosoma theileri TaxID=67003 RepID=A0A1X0P5T0_9TRYP|nr:uncharacterized protein TM35_000044050 [Trypanosoma theileri]ORC92191.1 hypothetical protein TM35_000044050 [Trypanosoma theileri]
MKVETQKFERGKRQPEEEKGEQQNQSHHSVNCGLSASNTALGSNVNHQQEKMIKNGSATGGRSSSNISSPGRSSISTTSGGTDAVDAMRAIPDLVGPFKTLVTNSLDEILQQRPADPLRVLAENLRKGSKTHEIEKHSCVVGASSNHYSPIVCTLTKACTQKNGAEMMQVPGIPLLLLVTPTSFELDAALRNLDALTAAKSKVIIFVEPPNPPTDLFYLKGVPYFANVTEQLLQRRRSGTLDETLNASVGSAAKITALLEETLQTHITTLQDELLAVATPPSRFQILYLPEIQNNVLEVFDVIDTAFGIKKKHWDESPPPGVPSVLLLSFNSMMSNMTFSRLISAMLPLHEQLQRVKIAKTLEHNKAYIQKLNYEYVTKYWREVLQRRDERDKLRGKSSKLGVSHSRTHNQSRSPKRQQQTDDKKNKSESFLARARRRENENTTFLHVTYELQSQAATRIQALYRGYKLRKKISVSHKEGVTSSLSSLPSRTAVEGEKEEKGKEKRKETSLGVPCWVEDLPHSLPFLLRQCMERLSAIHGELFGNYTVSCPPEPRCITVLKPSRKIVKANGVDDNVDSESETWEEERVALPMIRQTEMPPHFNPLRRLMECEYLSGCNTIEYAMAIQQDCTGLSVLQRRAYDCFKSLVLNLLHISYLELYHRGKLPMTVRTFDEYMHRFHTDVFGWFSVPHFLSRIALKNVMKSPNTVSLLCESEMMKIERVLLLCSSSEGQLYKSPYHQNQEQQQELKNGDTSHSSSLLSKNRKRNWVCPGVYAAPDFLSEASWEIALQDIPFNGEERKVAWWSLSPHPAVYVNGQPLVLVPRHEMQEVEGRPQFDKFVLHIENEKKTSPLPPKHAFHIKKTLSSSLSHSNQRKNSWSGVCDGLSTSLTGESDATVTKKETVTYHEEDEIPLSIFGASLRLEDDHLVHEIMQEISQSESDGKFLYYSIMGPSHLSPLPITYTWAQPLILCSEDIKRSDRFISRETSLAPSTSSSLIRSNHRRSNNRGTCSKVVGNARRRSLSVEKGPSFDSITKQSNSRRSSIASTESSSRRQWSANTRVSTLSLVESVDTIAQKVSQNVFKGNHFVHVRPWIAPECGRSWVLVFEKFISKCLVQLREGYSIILAIDSPSQLVLFNAVCLLKHAILKQPEVEKKGPNASITDVSKPNRHPSPPPSLLSNETIKCLSFMDSFYERVRELVKQTDISIPECVYTIHAVMKENAPGELMFLEELPILIRDAELETNPRILRENITTIVQRIELYCWLILFQVFLSSQATTSVFEEKSELNLSSFAAFVDDSSVRAWMDNIDPWQNIPTRSPDPFHLRYTNGLRRWDDRNYIFHGVV